MKRKIMLSLCFLFLAMGLLMAACQPVSPQPTEPAQAAPVLLYKDIAYGDHPLQTMDIFIPGGSPDARYPVVLTLHGGDWIRGDKESFIQYTDSILASNCIQVNINYRLLNNGIPANTAEPYEAMLDDIEAAFAYLAQYAERYQIDTTKAGIGGYSSGGHLALLYAYTRTDSPLPIRFVISEAGPTNFLDPKTFTEDGASWLHESHNGHGDIDVQPFMSRELRLTIIGAITGTDYLEPGWEAAWEQASPVYAVTPTSPKTYLIHGSHDPVVPISHAELLESRHPDCCLYELINASHDLYAMPTESQTLESILRSILDTL